MSDDKLIYVSEIFHDAFQGEGPHAGLHTTFVRFGLCDFKCGMCDSLHAVEPEQVHEHAMRLTQKQIFDKVNEAIGLTSVTFSGGNPCIHNLDLLCSKLQVEDIPIHVETQGTIWRDWLYECDSVVVSPKTPCMKETTNYNVYNSFLHNADKIPTDRKLFTLKFVIDGVEDLKWICEFINYQKSRCMLGRGWNSNIYLSLLNHHPNELMFLEELRDELMDKYIKLQPLVCEYSKYIRNLHFLPQLHVLAFGNERSK